MPTSPQILSEEQPVERFTLVYTECSDDPNYLVDAIMEPSKDGDYVRYSDYSALCQTVRALRAEQIDGETCEFCDEMSNLPDGSPRTFLVCGACWNQNAEVNRKTITDLRDEAATLQSRLSEVEKERAELRSIAKVATDEDPGLHLSRLRKLQADAIKDFRARVINLCNEKADEWEKRSDFGTLRGYVNRSAAARELAIAIENLDQQGE